jgi:putative pyruvate formate lyase activating enzyme
MYGIRNISKDIFNKDDQSLLSNCTLCPRECRVNRFEGTDGYCAADAGLNIASICIHRGEEPSISGPNGICNIFFAGCNLQCLFCQNYDISRPRSGARQAELDLNHVLDRIEEILSTGVKAVGFVSPSHVVPQMKTIIRGMNSRGLKPIIVYNTNGYDKPETLRSISDMIDVYLPDYKYITPGIASSFSDAKDYPEVAIRAIKEMYYQKGSTLMTDETGMAERGILIRHLVLPGHAAESIQVLKMIANEVSTGIHISLMSQYHPTPNVRNHSALKRPLYRKEYESVVEEMKKLGFRNGFIQDMDSFKNYKPDFRKKHPFES